MSLNREYLSDLRTDCEMDEQELRLWARNLDDLQPDKEIALLANAANALEDAARKLSDARDYLRDLIDSLPAEGNVK